MKKVMMIFVLSWFGFLFSPATYEASSGVSVIINGEKVAYDVEPDVYNGRTLVPMRITGDALGIDSLWSQENMEATFLKDGTELRFNFKNNRFLENGSVMEMDAEPRIVEGRVLVPLRVLSESFGHDVVWSGNVTKEVIITASRRTDEEPEEIENIERNDDIPIEEKDFGDREFQDGFGHLVSWTEDQLHNAFEDAFGMRVDSILDYYIDEWNINYTYAWPVGMVIFPEKREFDFEDDAGGGFGAFPSYSGDEDKDFSGEVQFLVNLGIIKEDEFDMVLIAAEEVSDGIIEELRLLDNGLYLIKADNEAEIVFSYEERFMR